LQYLRWPLSAIGRVVARRTRAAVEKGIVSSLEYCGGDLVFDDVLTVIFLSPGKLKIGKHAGFNRYVFINAIGGVSIGDDTRVGPYAVIHSGDHEYKDTTVPIWKQGHKLSSVAIGSDVWIGAHACILRGCVIPDHCIIGAGAIVDRHLKLSPFDIVRGNPAMVVGSRLQNRAPSSRAATGDLSPA